MPKKDPEARKAYHRAYYAEYYKKHKAHHIQRAKEQNKKYKEWFRSLKDGKPCTDCGQCFPYFVLHWDHIGTDKSANINHMVTERRARKVILEEISKCELVCANCHAYRTHARSHGEESSILSRSTRA